MPRVSIITPLYNHERYLARTVESVLAQTYPDWELLIWDDGSTDGGLALARRFAERHPDRVRVFTHPAGANLGQERTRNAALEVARGELVGLLDSDDLYDPRKLELLVACFERPEVGLAYGAFERLDDATGKRVPSGVSREPSGRVFETLCEENFLGACATLFRMSCLAAPGGPRFDARFRTIGEYPLWLALAHDWEVARVPETVAVWRDHEGNLGTRLALRAKAELVEFLRGLLESRTYPEHENLLRRCLARRRYDYASELHLALELAPARTELLAVLGEPLACVEVRAKAAALLAATLLGRRANSGLSRLKRRVWELRHPELVRR